MVGADTSPSLSSVYVPGADWMKENTVSSAASEEETHGRVQDGCLGSVDGLVLRQAASVVSALVPFQSKFRVVFQSFFTQEKMCGHLDTVT